MLLGSMCGRYQPLLGHSWDTFERFGLASVSLSMEETSMATIEQRTTRDGQTVYRVKVRRKGTPLQTATFSNGTLDLRAGQLRPHARADLLTKLAPVIYALYAEYVSRCAQMGEPRANQKEWCAALIERGYTPGRKKDWRGWYGIDVTGERDRAPRVTGDTW